MLPVLERLVYKPRTSQVTRVLVLVPTRELGIQVHSVARQLAQFTSITTCLAVGTTGYWLATLYCLFVKTQCRKLTALKAMLAFCTVDSGFTLNLGVWTLSSPQVICPGLSPGGLDLKSQEAALRAGPDILIATPGRLIDHLHNTPSFELTHIEILILDEADR